ncbi:MAG: polyribonucleotide nucleotidyltransferase [Erysipelotrichaceae bacterium]|nr:polyribonucleotide nucleotidyltransferase [Erysipelotrichaceae bacterium]
MEEKKIFKLNFRGKNLVVEVGELAKQANAACLVRYEDTAILSACVMSNQATSADFFPLTINYQEKFYSVGKIPGGFIKREGRPTEQAVLAARLIDRPIRPLFSEGFRNEVQVINTVLSVDQDCSPEMTALFGSSLSLCISDIPFDGPVAGVVVGRVNGEYIINPSVEELEQSDINLSVAGTKDAINMVESGSKEVSESAMIEAIMFGHEAIKELVAFQEEIMAVVGKAKIAVELVQLDEELVQEVNEFAREKMLAAIQIKDKLEKYAAIDQVKIDAQVYFQEKYETVEDLEKLLSDVKKITDQIEADEVRRLITEEHIRPDGRAMDEIRPLSASIDILARTHGSALFTRGQTQVLSTTTLGALGEHQILDGLGIEDEKRFMHHYNFPAFSVGETGRYGAPGRREIGHGALGERALSQVIPSEEEFPYTIRVVSEVLESNGSSSQASICAGCLSLMAAGVPIKAPVAGIAMGLITKDDKYTILTDIQGLEDHMGDMDFKVAGTRSGIVAMQMDIKIKGVSREILSEALAQAKKARMQILDVMEAVIPEPRKELSKYAPKIETIMINPEKIKDVIGRGGDMITKIILEASHVKTVQDKDAVKVDLEDDGRVIVYHSDAEIIKRTIQMIEDVAREVEIGKIYPCRVVSIQEFGAFVELWPGCEGLIHVSQLDTKRVEKVSDVVKPGDEVMAIATGYDKKGKLNLSRRDVLLRNEKKETK